MGDLKFWTSLLDKFGWPAVTVIVLMWFFHKKIWPFLIGQMEYYQRQLDKSQAEFLQAIERRDAEYGKMTDQLGRNTEALKAHTDVVRQIVEDCNKRR